jgi:anti-anti-sigma factor
MAAEVDPVAEAQVLDTPVIAVEKLEDVILIRLFGERDAATVSEIQTAVTRGMIGGSGVAVSLAGVTFMDSAVIHTLVIGDRKLTEVGRRLVLYAEPGSPADRVLELCCLNQALLFGDTLEEAVEFARQVGAEIPAA